MLVERALEEIETTLGAFDDGPSTAGGEPIVTVPAAMVDSDDGVDDEADDGLDDGKTSDGEMAIDDTADEEDDTEDDGDGPPGFGLVVALASILAAAGFVRHNATDRRTSAFSPPPTFRPGSGPPVPTSRRV